MKKIMLLTACLLIMLCTFSQVRKPSEVVKENASDRVNSNVSNGVDKGLNKAEGAIKGLFSKKKNKTKSKSTAQEEAQPVTDSSKPGNVAGSPGLKAYQNYDFVPGEKILFSDDFQSDQVGELPAHWLLCYGQGQVNDFDGKKVFMLVSGEQGDNAAVLEPRMKTHSGYMPGAFTVEFDMYVPRAADDDDDIRLHWAGLNFYGDDNPIDSYNDWALTPERLDFYSGELSDGSKDFPESIADNNFVNKWHHIAIACKDRQMKIYLDQNRLYVIPQVKNPSINKFGIRVAGKCVVTNIRLAEGGGMNMIGKKFTDAKIITHGINFDIDKATLRPESMGTLNMIVQVMKENPDIKFEIDGHTDNTGNAAHNLALSEQRANAVRTQLVNMGIEPARLTAKGFGDTRPIVENTTPEGKANNRRVEFVKITS